MRYVVPAFVSAIVMAAFAAFHITNGTGCQKWETTDKLNRMLLEGDQITADRLYRAAVAIGECRHFTAGQRVYVVEWHSFGQSVLFRPEGETREYWGVYTTDPRPDFKQGEVNALE